MEFWPIKSCQLEAMAESAYGEEMIANAPAAAANELVLVAPSRTRVLCPGGVTKTRRGS